MALNNQTSNLQPEAQPWVRQVEASIKALQSIITQQQVQIASLKKRVK